MDGLTVRQLPIRQLSVDELNPRDDPGDLTELAASIKAGGIHTPLIVREMAGGWAVLSGLRQLMRCRGSGWIRSPHRRIGVCRQPSYARLGPCLHSLGYPRTKSFYGRHSKL